MRAPLLVCLFVMTSCHPAPALLSDAVVESGDGLMKAHVPLGDGWHCSKNDLDKQTFQQRSIKCVDDKGVVMTASVLDVETNNARSAQLWCIQDWKQAYSNVFTGVKSYAHDVVDWHGYPACQVTLDGASTKGPWHLFEIHAPNGRRLLQITVTGFTPEVEKDRAVIDAWLADLRYDLKLPGQ